MISIGTAVFRRIIEETRQQGREEARKAGIQAVKKTMFETVRFGTFKDDYIEGCATDRVDSWLEGKGW